MSRRQKEARGKQVYNKYFSMENFTSREHYENAIKETVSYLKSAWWLYRDNQVGTVRVFRNPRGARVIAYDLPEVS